MLHISPLSPCTIIRPLRGNQCIFPQIFFLEASFISIILKWNRTLRVVLLLALDVFLCELQVVFSA